MWRILGRRQFFELQVLLPKCCPAGYHHFDSDVEEQYRVQSPSWLVRTLHYNPETCWSYVYPVSFREGGGGYKFGFLCTSKKKIGSITWPFLDGSSTLRSSGHALYTSSWTASKVRPLLQRTGRQKVPLKNKPKDPKGESTKQFSGSMCWFQGGYIFFRCFGIK